MAEHSEEVITDFADSLRDLVDNNRYQIQNLTLIAKEYTEYAQAISEALERHIKTVPPARKLPALYVLDSIIKNVGTPYTVYLGRKLFSTFMEAYGLVDGATRRSMEQMLKTWKLALDGTTRGPPVLDPALVKPIDTALARFQAVTVQRQPQMQQGYAATPPQPYGHFLPPGQPVAYQQQAYAPPQSQVAPHDLENLKRDVSWLISIVQQEQASDPYSFNSHKLAEKLKALHDLNTILHTQYVDAAQFGMIAGQVRSMMPVRAQPTPPVAVSQWHPPAQTQYNPPLPQQQPIAVPPVQLNDLAALLNTVPKPSTPQVRASVPSLQNAPHAQVSAIQTQATAAPSTSGSDLLATLTKAGLLKSTPAPPTPQPAPAIPANLAALLGSLSKQAVPQAPVRRKIDLTDKSSLATFRPELVQELYGGLPNQCPQCGRRFADNATGSKQKSLHLDWHFRVNQRIADGARGHHRNWFLNEMDWIKLVEFDESTSTADAVASTQASAKDGAKKTTSYVRAPAGVTKVVCSICYEEMRSSYVESIQDWAFIDAVMNGGKIVHASCLAEMQQGVQSVTQATQQNHTSLAATLAALSNPNRDASRTPDSTLGKRKAEDQVGGVEKLLKES